MTSRKEHLQALKQRLSARYGIAGAVLGTFIVTVGIFVIPFSAVACVGCVMPIVAALGLTGTVAGLAGKNAYIIVAGVVLLALSGYLLFLKKNGNHTCETRRRR